MGTPKAITSSDGPVGVRLEYVKRRRVVRASARCENDHLVAPLELPVADLVKGLGLDTDDLRLPNLYLLLAEVADHPSGRGQARLRMAVFETEDEARQAFRRLRLRLAPATAWAEVVAVDVQRTIRRVCWFGESRGVGAGRDEWWDDAVAPVRATTEVTGRRGGAGRRRAVWRRSGGAAAAAVAVDDPVAPDATVLELLR